MDSGLHIKRSVNKEEWEAAFALVCGVRHRVETWGVSLYLVTAAGSAPPQRTTTSCVCVCVSLCASELGLICYPMCGYLLFPKSQEWLNLYFILLFPRSDTSDHARLKNMSCTFWTLLSNPWLLSISIPLGIFKLNLDSLALNKYWSFSSCIQRLVSAATLQTMAL